jgi:hypothetical protein
MIATHPDSSPTETFGFGDQLPRYAAEQLLETLSELWRACHHRAPGAIRPDLDLHRRFFDPVAQGNRLRKALLSIDTYTPPGPIHQSQALAVDAERLLITPEGRVAIELLDRAIESTGEQVTIDVQLAAVRERDLLALYRDWGRHRLRSVIDLLGGGEKPLQIPAIGAVLTLLVNRCDSPERAITRFPPGTARDVIDDVFRTCANAFSEQLAPSTRRATNKERLISGWTLGEIARRMPDALHSSDARGVYVIGERRTELIRLIISELARREGVDKRRLEEAFDALVREFTKRSQALAGYGLLFARPAETERLRASLVDAWEQNLPSP